MPNPSRETKFSGANANREISIFPIMLTTSRIGNLTQLIHTLAPYMSTFFSTNIVISTAVIDTSSKLQLAVVNFCTTMSEVIFK